MNVNYRALDYIKATPVLTSPTFVDVRCLDDGIPVTRSLFGVPRFMGHDAKNDIDHYLIFSRCPEGHLVIGEAIVAPGIRISFAERSAHTMRIISVPSLN
jgi:hypothetical protein